MSTFTDRRRHIYLAAYRLVCIGWGSRADARLIVIGSDNDFPYGKKNLMMRAAIYGMLVAIPVHYPDDIEVKIFHLDRSDNARTGGCFTISQHAPWDLLKAIYRVNEISEAHIKAGRSVTLFVGDIQTHLSRSTVLPDGLPVQIHA
jgi:hypothetical protein